MKHFILKMLIFSLLVATTILLSCIVVIFLPPSPRVSSSYFFGQRQKDILLSTTESPRIIFIAGSSMALGLDSEMVKTSLRINPINNGLSFPLGLKFMLDNTCQYIRESDIVVVAAEYLSFYEDHYLGNGQYLQQLVWDVDKTKIRLLTFGQIITMAKYIPNLISIKFKDLNTPNIGEVNMVYHRNAFNEYGDVYSHWDLENREFDEQESINIEKYNHKAMKKLKEFEETIHKKGAMLFISYPPYQDISFDLSIESIKKIEEEFIKQGFTVLGTPERYRMDNSLMFDSPYHLNRNGTVLRTELLIEDLREAGVGHKLQSPDHY